MRRSPSVSEAGLNVANPPADRYTRVSAGALRFRIAAELGTSA